MLNAVNIALVAFANFRTGAQGAGVLFSLFVITLAAAEVTVGLAIVIANYRTKRTVQADEFRRDEGLTEAARGEHRLHEDRRRADPAAAAGRLHPDAARSASAWGRKAHLLPVALVTGSAVLAVYAFEWVFRHQEEPFVWNAFTWIAAGRFEVAWGFQVDTLTGIMLLVVGVIGMLVHYYSIGYMHGDERLLPLLRLPEPLHVRDVRADPRRQLPAHVPRLGGRGPLLVPADQLLVPQEEREPGGQEGLPRQPRRRLRLHAGHAAGLRHHRARCSSPASSRRPRSYRAARRRGSACCSSSAPSARAPSSRCTCGCRTPWRARPRSAP